MILSPLCLQEYRNPLHHDKEIWSFDNRILYTFSHSINNLILQSLSFSFYQSLLQFHITYSYAYNKCLFSILNFLYWYIFMIYRDILYKYKKKIFIYSLPLLISFREVPAVNKGSVRFQIDFIIYIKRW